MFYSVLYRVKQNEAIYILSFIYMAKAYLKLSGFKIKKHCWYCLPSSYRLGCVVTLSGLLECSRYFKCCLNAVANSSFFVAMALAISENQADDSCFVHKQTSLNRDVKIETKINAISVPIRQHFSLSHKTRLSRIFLHFKSSRVSLRFSPVTYLERLR